MTTDPSVRDEPADVSARVRAAFCVVAGALIVFIAGTVLYNLPASTVTTRMRPTVDVVMHPWFEQDWQLFAPTPASSNTRLMVTARIERPDHSIVETPAFDVQQPIEDMPKSNHILPTKRPGITLAAQERMSNYSRELATIDKAPPAARAPMHRALDERYRSTLDEIDRFMSRCAQDRFPHARIVAVRGAFTSTPMTPFSARTMHNPPPLPTKTIVTTSWDPFVADVQK